MCTFPSPLIDERVGRRVRAIEVLTRYRFCVGK